MALEHKNLWIYFAAFSFFALGGCASPSAANNKLREENMALSEKIDQLNRQHDMDHAKIESLENKTGTVNSLPDSELARLFTASGLQLGRLSRVQYPDSALTKADSTVPTLVVDVVPVDQQAQQLKAAGSFKIDLLDLEDTTPVSAGHWDFTTEQARESWFGQGLLYNYILNCPLKNKPAHEKLLLRVTFTEELTGRQFKAEKYVK